jgi:hypothetical protein
MIPHLLPEEELGGNGRYHETAHHLLEVFWVPPEGQTCRVTGTLIHEGVQSGSVGFSRVGLLQQRRLYTASEISRARVQTGRRGGGGEVQSTGLHVHEEWSPWRREKQTPMQYP